MLLPVTNEKRREKQPPFLSFCLSLLRKDPRARHVVVHVLAQDGIGPLCVNDPSKLDRRER